MTLLANLPVLKELLSAFSSAEGANQMVMDLCPQPSPGSFEYVLCGTYAYLDSLHDAGVCHPIRPETQLVSFQSAYKSLPINAIEGKVLIRLCFLKFCVLGIRGGSWSSMYRKLKGFWIALQQLQHH